MSKYLLITNEKLKCQNNETVEQSLKPLIKNSPCRGEGTSHKEVSIQVHQQEEFVGASLNRSIRTNRSSYINAKDLIRC